jgi:superfamily I DNA and/or RNA helicase
VGRILQTWLAKPGNAAVDPASVVGIITPYRSQIALIRKVLQELAIPNCANIVVDTVERFQGGQRDLMIYSCCMNMTYQLGFLSNTIEEEGAVIDRKLNVALTRARKQLFIVGNPDILCQDPIYARLIEHIRERGGYYRGE